MRRVTYFILTFILFGLQLTPAAAQTGYGSDVGNYTCEGVATGIPGSTITISPVYDSALQRYICPVASCSGKPSLCPSALPVPPKLRQVEVWFVSVIYLLWSFAGIFFTGVLVIIGLAYMVGQGSSEQVAALKKRIQQWVIGLLLVFLSYPALATVFSLIGLNQCLASNITLPGFQFFFESVIDESTCR